MLEPFWIPVLDLSTSIRKRKIGLITDGHVQVIKRWVFINTTVSVTPTAKYSWYRRLRNAIASVQFLTVYAEIILICHLSAHAPKIISTSVINPYINPYINLYIYLKSIAFDFISASYLSTRDYYSLWWNATQVMFTKQEEKVGHRFCTKTSCIYLRELIADTNKKEELKKRRNREKEKDWYCRITGGKR